MAREGDSAEERFTLDRRAMLKLGAAGAAVLGTSLLVERKGSAGTKSPFDAPFDATAGAAAHPAPAAASIPPPATIISRAEWHADERLRSHAIDFDRAVTKLIVHHTGTTNAVSDWAAEVRAIYRNAVNHEYRDMPYHWLIDPEGNVYEGRWARRTPAGAVPNGEDARGRSVRGGHTLRHNRGTIGIALLGTFDRHQPTAGALEALVALLAWKAARWGIDPRGATHYRVTGGTAQTFPNICGHRTLVATDCPGGIVTQMLPELRAAVAGRLA